MIRAGIIASRSWYDSRWCYRKSVTIADGKITGALSSWPMLVLLSSDSDLASHALSSGNDILFALPDGTKLSHELVSYTTSSGALIAWVKVPNAYAGASIYLYYGNSTASAQQSAITVWDSSFAATYHFSESSSPALDSTSNANNPADVGGVTFGATGKVGRGLTLDGTNDKLSAPNSSSLNVTGALTIEGWVKPSSTGKMRIAAKVATNGATANPFDFGLNIDNTLYLNRADASHENFMTGVSALSASSWTHVAVRVGGQAADFSNLALVKKMPTANQAWQGVAFDGTNLYVVSDKDQFGSMSNTITKMDTSGTIVFTKTAAYNPFPAGQFYSFGNASVIGTELFVGCYNANYLNASGNPNYTPLSNLKSRIAVFSLIDGSLLRDYDLGNAVAIAEGVDYYDGYYWVIDGWFGRFKVSKYDSSFNLVATYLLPVQAPFLGELTYQAISWRGSEIFCNWHGDNSYAAGGSYARGLDRYSWDGTQFTFVQRLRPPTFGAGQGIAISGNTFYWADRPANSIYSSTFVGAGQATDTAVTDFFINGLKEPGWFTTGSTQYFGLVPTPNSSAMLIGTRGDGTDFFNGSLDEVRFSAAARSDAWLAANYANQDDPSSFVVLGPEQLK